MKESEYFTVSTQISLPVSRLGVNTGGSSLRIMRSQSKAGNEINTSLSGIFFYDVMLQSDVFMVILLPYLYHPPDR